MSRGTRQRISVPTISTASVRLFLGAQGMLADAGRSAGRGAPQKVIEQMGFVQLDSINAVERAHHLILASRLDAYRREDFVHLLEQDRSLFEHWTHCASAIPTKWFAHWKPRFARAREYIRKNPNWQRYLGERPDEVVDRVRRRIAQEGPLRSQDFEHNRGGRPPGWHRWRPPKAALEFLWFTGELMITHRENFQKVYDLTERVLPAHHELPSPTEAEQVEWACRTAFERLVIATPKEIARFWKAVTAAQTRRWCQDATRTGRLVPVFIRSSNGPEQRPSFALADWERRLGRLPDPPERMRLLCPFDPVVGLGRRLGFDYRFEVFAPEAKREYGYYVMPILEGERLVGRVDPQFQRDRGVLAIRRVYWEPNVTVTRARCRKLEEAAIRLARFIGAERVAWPVSSPGRFKVSS